MQQQHHTWLQGPLQIQLLSVGGSSTLDLGTGTYEKVLSKACRALEFLQTPFTFACLIPMAE